MNRAVWRDKVLKRLSWTADLSANTIDDVNRCLNDAQNTLAADVPGAFVPDVANVVLLPDHTDTSLVRTVSATSDLWVLNFGPVATGGALVTDGTWDGIYHIEATDPDGVLHRRTIREFFMATVDQDPLSYLATLDRPWRNTTDAGMTFRLHMPEFFFRDDVMEVLDGHVWNETRTQLMPLPENFLSHYNDGDFLGRSKGPPDYLVRGRNVQVDAPTKAPVLDFDNADEPAPAMPWLGPHPRVRCRMVYTYVWGKRDAEFLAPQGSYDPMFESSPSPISNSLTMVNSARRLQLSGLPNIDFMQNFDIAGTLRRTHSGIRKRIYVYIDEIVPGGGYGTDSIEAQGVALYVGEVDGDVTNFFWDGSVIPDYKRRLPEVHGYFAHRMATHQDKRYEVDFRVRRRPRDLNTEQDAPQLAVDGNEALVRLGMSYVSELIKKTADAVAHMVRYEKIEKPKVQALVGNPEKVVPAIPWGYTSVRARSLNNRLGRFTA